MYGKFNNLFIVPIGETNSESDAGSASMTNSNQPSVEPAEIVNGNV
jgi:hypothetical protein